MPLTTNTLAGIAANGIGWRAEINLKGQPKRLADPDKLKVGDCAAIRDSIVKRVRAFLGSPAAKRSLPSDAIISIDAAVDDVDLSDDDPDELKDALNRLYDQFDYHRVVVVG